MTLTQYNTATSIDGFIADEDNSLEWLFRVDAEGIEDRFAGGRNVWLVGGGELVGQFADAGLLDSVSDADDAVQESWLRLSRSDTSGVANLGGWLTTVVARVCLDMLRSRTSRREEPVGTHLT